MFSQTIVVGNLGRDPEMRYTQGGVPVCSFSVAHTEKWTDSHGAAQEAAWFRVSAWNKLAELPRIPEEGPGSHGHRHHRRPAPTSARTRTSPRPAWS